MDEKGEIQTVTDHTGSSDASYTGTTVESETRYFFGNVDQQCHQRGEPTAQRYGQRSTHHQGDGAGGRDADRGHLWD